MDAVGICYEDLKAGQPRERPEFEALEGEEEYNRQMRKSGVVGTWVLFDWHEDGHKAARRQRLESHGNVEVNDPEEAYCSDLYKAAFEELFLAVYGHPYRYKSRKAYHNLGVDDDDNEDDDDDDDDGDDADEDADEDAE